MYNILNIFLSQLLLHKPISKTSLQVCFFYLNLQTCKRTTKSVSSVKRDWTLKIIGGQWRVKWFYITVNMNRLNWRGVNVLVIWYFDISIILKFRVQIMLIIYKQNGTECFSIVCVQCCFIRDSCSNRYVNIYAMRIMLW